MEYSHVILVWNSKQIQKKKLRNNTFSEGLKRRWTGPQWGLHDGGLMGWRWGTSGQEVDGLGSSRLGRPQRREDRLGETKCGFRVAGSDARRKGLRRRGLGLLGGATAGDPRFVEESSCWGWEGCAWRFLPMAARVSFFLLSEFKQMKGCD